MAGKCQSCSIPLNKDPGGSEADGSRSAKYCSLCYQNGKFMQPGFTVREMQEYCIDQLNKKGVPRWLGWVFTRPLPKLDRWRTS